MFHASFVCVIIYKKKKPALGNSVIKNQDFPVSTHVIWIHYIQKRISYKKGSQPNMASVY